MVPDPLPKLLWNSGLLVQGIKNSQFCQQIHLLPFQTGLSWIFLNAPEELEGTQGCQLPHLPMLGVSSGQRLRGLELLFPWLWRIQKAQCGCCPYYYNIWVSMYRKETNVLLAYKGYLEWLVVSISQSLYLLSEWECWMPDCTKCSLGISAYFWFW